MSAKTFPCRHTGRAIHVQHHLVAVARRPAIEIRRQRCLGQQTERVGTPLRRRDFLSQAPGLRPTPSLAEQLVGRRFERALDHGANLGREAAADDDHPVVVDPGREVPVQAPRLGLLRRRHAVDPPPGAGQAFDVGGGTGLREVEQRGFVLWRGDTGQRPHLGIRDAPRAIVALTSGRAVSACATRTFSRAAPRAIPVRQCSQ